MDEPDRRFDAWQKSVPYAVGRPRRRGLAVVIAIVGVFGGWALMAPLDGAVLATGSFIANGQNKPVQHLEGGIVREILVREGDLVERDQVLVRLDETPARAIRSPSYVASMNTFAATTDPSLRAMLLIRAPSFSAFSTRSLKRVSTFASDSIALNVFSAALEMK